MDFWRTWIFGEHGFSENMGFLRTWVFWEHGFSENMVIMCDHFNKLIAVRLHVFEREFWWFQSRDALIVIWSQDVEKVIFNTLFLLSSLTCLIFVWDGGAFFPQCVIQWHAFSLRLSDKWFSLLQCLWIVLYNKVVVFRNKVFYSYTKFIQNFYQLLETLWHFLLHWCFRRCLCWDVLWHSIFEHHDFFESKLHVRASLTTYLC